MSVPGKSYICLVEKNRTRLFLELSYQGTHYHGWQIQQNALSVQELLNKALSTLFGQQILCTGCGRTDAGVHAKQMFAHFDLVDAGGMGESCPAASGKGKARALRGLNALLPRDIAVKDLFEVRPEAHARFDALTRTYRYCIHSGKNPFLNDFSWQIRDGLDLDKMNEAAQALLSYRDFSCFSKSNTQVFTNDCTIQAAQWRGVSQERLIFEITANRFLRNMVRAIVGTLVEIGRGDQPVEHIHKVLQSKSRSLAGVSVPACGLYLLEVRYPPEIKLCSVK